MMSECPLGLGGRLEGKTLRWNGRVWKARRFRPKHLSASTKFISSLTFYIKINVNLRFNFILCHKNLKYHL